MKRSLLPAWVLLSCLLSAAFGLQLGDMGRALTSPGQYERLPSTFSYWDATPAARHLGLAFQGPDAVAQGRAYVHLTPAWLGLMYALMKPLAWGGVSYATGQNVVVFLTFGLMLWMVFSVVALSRSEGVPNPAAWAVCLPLVLLGFNIVATLPSLWVAAVVGNPEDQNRFIAALGAAYVSALDFQKRALGLGGFLTLVGVVGASPLPCSSCLPDSC